MEEARQKKRLFYRLFFTMICLIVVPMVGISAFSFAILQKNIEREITRSNLSLLFQTRQSVDSLLETTIQIASQIAYDPLTNRFMEQGLSLGAYQDILFYKQLMERNDTAILDNQYVKSISVYSRKNNLMVTTGTGMMQKLNAENIQDIFGRLREAKGALWLEPSPKAADIWQINGIGYVRTIYDSYAVPSGFVVVRLQGENLNWLINEIFLMDSGYVTLMNRNGEGVLVGARGDRAVEEAIAEQGLLQGKDGYGEILVEGREMLISFASSRFNDWHYVAVLPAKELTSGTPVFGLSILGICGGLVLLLGSLSYLVSKHYYNPIAFLSSLLLGEKDWDNQTLQREKLESRGDEIGTIFTGINQVMIRLKTEQAMQNDIKKQNESLRLQVDEEQEKVRSFFIYRILLSDVPDPKELAEQAGTFGIPIQGRYITTIITLDENFKKLLERASQSETSLVRKELVEILEEILGRETVPVKLFFDRFGGEERIIAILLLPDKEAEETAVSLKQLFRYIQSYLYSQLQFSVAIVAGRCYSRLSDIRTSYEEALECLRYKTASGDESLIFLWELDQQAARDAAGRTNTEYRRKFYNALKTGDGEQVHRLFTQFREKEMFSDGAFCRDMINLALEAYNQAGYQNHQRTEELNRLFFIQDGKGDSAWGEHILALVEQAVLELVEWPAGKDTRPPDIAQKILKMIHENYFQDIGISQAAEQLGLSEGYFSKVFKERFGKTFKRYLTDYRMEIAKKMLVETNTPIQEISSAVGYNNHNQFSKMFRLHEGISPTQYRSLYRQ